MKILVADPAKNITVFVLDPVESQEERLAVARLILAEKSLMAEQVGFVIPPGNLPAEGGLWRLEMAGGEFCGNAARSFGLYVAAQQGLKGLAKVLVSVSGAAGPVAVEVDVERGRAAAEMPKPQLIQTLDYKGRSLTVIIFEGITHVIAPDMEAKSETFYAVKSVAEKELFPLRENLPAAIGVMFYDTAARFLRPAVYVRATDTLVFESSCGSGSVALGIWLSLDLPDGRFRYALNQSGGVIETEVVKRDGEIVHLTIGGEVSLTGIVLKEDSVIKSGRQ